MYVWGDEGAKKREYAGMRVWGAIKSMCARTGVCTCVWRAIHSIYGGGAIKTMYVGVP